MLKQNNKSEEQLIEEIQNGSDKAIEALINKCRSTVEAIAMKYINSPFEKDDLIQEGMIGLLAAIHSYKKDKNTKFMTYANRCINNSIQSSLRKFSRMKDIPQSSIVSLQDDCFAERYVLSAEDEYLAKESVCVLSDKLYEELSSFENEVLRLHIVGCSYAEIAKKLDKNPKAVDNAIQRIRKKLTGVAF